MLTSIYKRIPLREERRQSSIELNEVRTDDASNTYNFTNLKNRVINNGDIFQDDRLNSTDEATLKKPILLLACEGKGDYNRVDASTVQRLLKNGAQIDYIDQEWYGWEAIHYVASASNPEKLKILCDKLGQDRINTLTMLSENALHILLEHCSSAESFLVSCQNGLDLKMSKLINKEQENVTECARILIEANIDVNHANFWNETPILVAIKRKYFEVVKLLLKRKDIDLDSCKDAVSGKTARELLKGRDNLGILPPPCGIKPEKILFQLLKSGDEENFLKYNGGKISEFVNIIDGDIENNSSCTLLQYCFRRGLIFWHQDKITHDCDLQFPSQEVTANCMVQVFCQSGMAKCVQHLLDNGADVDFRLRKFEGGRTLLEAAIVKGFYPLVALILGKNDKLSPEKLLKIYQAMNTLVQRNDVSNADLNNTLSVVLNRMIDFPMTPEIVTELKELLSKGVKDISKENLLLIFKFPGSLSCDETNSKMRTILKEMDPEILKAHLDDCVEQKGKDIYINYDSFLEGSSVQSVFQTFLSSVSLQEFLNHLVFKILIMRQWESLRFRWRYFQMKYFYLNFFFYVIFYTLLNLYILFKFNGDSPMFLKVPGLVCLVIFIAKELFQILADFRLYLKEKSNYCEICFIICTAIVYFSDAKWIDSVEVFTILTSNLVLLFLLVNVPKFSKYIIILQTIVFYLRYMFFYFIQFLAFAICFYILFSKKDQVVFIDLPNKIFETIILFTGNLDQMETPWRQDSKSKNETSSDSLYHNFQYKEVVSKTIFIIFVLFIAVILQNLLLGLLVIDMSNLHKDVVLSEQVKRASFAVRVGAFFKSSCMKSVCINKIFQYNTQNVDTEIIVNDNDRKILNDEEKQNLNFILTKKSNKPNVLKKLRNYIRIKITERVCERNGKNKEIAEKLEMIEEMIKNLH